jgi:putative ABC transport system permease protein
VALPSALPRLALTGRGLWWRRGSAMTLLAVATVTVTAAALGPVFAQAASESTLRDRLTAAPVTETGLMLTDVVDASQPGAASDVTANPPAAGALLGYPTRIAAIGAQVRVHASGTDSPQATTVVWRQGYCAHLVVVLGRCPTAPGEAMVSARTVGGGYGWRLGSVLSVAGLTVDQPGGPQGSTQVGLALKVVGEYRPVDAHAPYWFEHPYFQPHLGSGDNPDTVDAVFVDPSTFSTLSVPSPTSLTLDYPLDATRIRLADEDRLRSQVLADNLRYTAADTAALHTDLPAVLAAADHERALLQVSTLLVAAQLALLAWLVLFTVVTDAAEARGNEVALAKLRGFRPWSTVAFGLGQPVAVLAAAVPAGLLGAWLVVEAMAHLVLVAGTPVALSWAAVAGALAGFTGAALGASLAARRVLTRPVLEQWRRVPDAHHSTASLVVDLLAAAAAVGGLVLLRQGAAGAAGPRPVSLLGPGLLVLAVALLGVRLLPYLGRAALGPTRASARIGSFLAVRQVLRRPAGLRLAALLAVAVGLATFAVDGEAVASANRDTRARLEVGAQTVLATQYDRRHDPVAITRRVDPQGRWAMAVARWNGSGGAVTGQVLAVDTSRLAAVARWPAGSTVPVGVAASALGPRVPSPVLLTGTAVRVHLTTLSRGPGPAPDVAVELQPGSRDLVLQTGGPLQAGAATYSVPVPCASGCTLLGLVLDRPIDFSAQMRGSVLVTGFDVGSGGAWTALDARLSQPGQWRQGGFGGLSADSLTPTPQGLRDAYSSTFGASPGIEHIDSASPLPLLATGQAVRHDLGPAGAVLLDGTQTPAAFEQVGTVALLPAVLDDGVLVDVRDVAAQLPDFAQEADWQVWLSAAAPPDAVARLEAAGLPVQTLQSEPARVSQLSRQGPALALLLLVVCAVAGALLAAGLTALAVAVSGRRRAFELAALAAVGVSRRSLLRSCVGEQLILLGTGFALGVPTGVVAAALTLPVIPQYADTTPVPLDYAPQVLPVAAFAAALAAVLVLTALLSGRVLVRSAVPTRLREAAQ